MAAPKYPVEWVERAQALRADGLDMCAIANVMAGEGVKSMRSQTPCTPTMVYNWLHGPLKATYKKQEKKPPMPVVDMTFEDHMVGVLKSILTSDTMPAKTKLLMIASVLKGVQHHAP